MKILEALSFRIEFGQDDIYGRVLYFIDQTKDLIAPNDSGELKDEIKWLHNQSVDLLEMLYFDYELLTSFSVDELACGIIQASLVMLSRHQGTTPVTIKLHCVSDSIDLAKIIKIS